MSIILSFFLALTGAVALAQDQGVVIGDQGAKGGWRPPADFREEIENYQMLRQRPPASEIRQLKVKPILDPLGNQLVAIVENRTLSKPQMDLRVNLAIQMQNQPEPEDKQVILDRRITLENRIVDAWAKATTLAVLAERLGYKATPAEVDQAMRDLSAQSSMDPAHAVQQVSLLGIPEGELRRELEDGIIVEKMLREQVQTFSDDSLKRVYARDPGVFLEPTRVKAWHLLAVMANSPTEDEIDTIKDLISKYAKKLKKCDKPEEFEALKKEIGTDKGIVLTYLDNVASDEPLKAPVIKALFGQKSGSTSSIIATPEKPAKPTEFHVVKVLERKDGHKGTWEEAKPQVQNYMIEKLKDYTYESLLQKYDIRSAPGGLNEYIDVNPQPAAAGRQLATPGQPAPTPTPATPALRNPYAPRPGTRGSVFGQPPPVEAIVGAKAELPAPGTRKPVLTPEAQKALDEMTARGQITANAAALLTQDLDSTTSAQLAPAPAAAVVPAPVAPTPLPRRTTTRRGRSAPQHNYDSAPPSVEEVLGRRARER